MKILAIDSSAVSASVAVSEDKAVLANAFCNNGLTHSQTLLPMVDDVLCRSNLSAKDIECIAVTTGPGSFTGVRIGVALAKGLAFSHSIPCIGVSTLELIAAGVSRQNAIVLACMDARRSQIYTATFESETLLRLSEDEAVAVASLPERINSYAKPVILAGDGAVMAYELLKEQCHNISLAPEEERFQHAKNLCALALTKHQAVAPAQLVPTYLRMSQAQRELQKRKDTHQ